MVHDKTYFMGVLHTKMSEITSEISKLSGQIDSLAKEQSTYIAYETRVKEKASELQGKSHRSTFETGSLLHF